VGPLAAIALYQRSVHRELEAMRLALTDPLTGLGNRRSFFEQLERDVLNAEVGGPPVALCVLDIDDFKEINDERGHLAGDRVLVAVAARLRQNGEAFRLGGDEFALLLHRRPADAVATAKEVLTRLPVSASAGIVAYPQPGTERGELVQLADSALYRAKEQGKRGVHLHRPSPAPVGDLRRLADDRDRDARLSAAASLAHAVDARDAYIGAHSSVVSELAARIAAAMNLSADAVELTRLAGNLHDLGKLAVPEEILRKPGSLTDEERLVVERHPEIGFRMLESLGVEPVATWVRHHHERWDGGGYPDGLAGRAIPLGSRIVFVADAYDAMTSDRVYGARVSHETAVGELERCAGAQFDPDVVAAFLAGLTRAELAALKAS
jgi:diguanylate cyclase (GGDEF)-like protein